MHSLTLTDGHLQAMIEHVNAHVPLEACGLLAGKGSRVEKVFGVPNQAESPLRYMMEPAAQLSAFEWIESNGMELLGIFHSHPAGPDIVSPTDVAEAAYPVVHIILAHVEGKWSARGFWIENAAFEEVELKLE